MTSNTLYIIAGNMEEYINWVMNSKTKYPNQNFYYVVSSTDFRNTNNPDGLFIGTWYERKDIQEIFHALQRSCTDNTKSTRIYDIKWDAYHKWKLHE